MKIMTHVASILLFFLSISFFADTANPSYFKLLNLPGYLFSGDANDPKVQDAIKTNYITVTKGPFVPPLFCRDKPAECNPNTVEVYAGAKA